MFRLKPLAALVPAVLALGALQTAGAADTGDAPVSYGTASHTVVEGTPWLGDVLPDDNEPVATAAADGDDIAGGDDENGIFDLPTLVQNTKRFATDVFASNPGPHAANLAVWIDFDGNGRFDADEYSSAVVPAGTDNGRFTLSWRGIVKLANGFFGDTYLRARITTDPMPAGDAVGSKSDGEVEDYTLFIEPDVDGDAIPDSLDTDNDNDGIPDIVEVVGTDSDGDGQPDYLDTDSDNDGIPDFVEAGPDATSPVDADGDGTPDYLDTDSDNDGRPDGQDLQADRDGDGVADEFEGAGDTDRDGILNIDDIDADNDGLPDALEYGGDAAMAADSDRDGVPDFLDLDSDNDGLPDLYEGNSGEVAVRDLDVDRDGRIDSGLPVGANGLLDALETAPESGVPVYAVPDTDADGARDFIDLDSDADGLFDVVESGRPDVNADGRVDELVDTDGDGLPDAIDVDLTGGADADGDGIDDSFDSTVSVLDDLDGDGIGDVADIDIDGDGLVDGANAVSFGDPPDGDGDGRPDFQDAIDDGAVDGGSTGGGDSGGGTAGGTTGGTIVGTTGNVPDDDGFGGGRVETGLEGGAGCSITSGSGAADPLFSLFALASLGLLLRRRGARKTRDCLQLTSGTETT